MNFISEPKYVFRFNHDPNGKYSVGTMKKMIDSHLIQFTGHPICWLNVIPLKVRCFIWRDCLGRIPIAETLTHRDIIVKDFNCQPCNQRKEPVNHLLVDREFAKVVQLWIFKWCRIHSENFTTIREFVDGATSWGNYPSKRQVGMVICYSIMWNICMTNVQLQQKRRILSFYKHTNGTNIKGRIICGS